MALPIFSQPPGSEKYENTRDLQTPGEDHCQSTQRIGEEHTANIPQLSNPSNNGIQGSTENDETYEKMTLPAWKRDTSRPSSNQEASLNGSMSSQSSQAMEDTYEVMNRPVDNASSSCTSEKATNEGTSQHDDVNNPISKRRAIANTGGDAEKRNSDFGTSSNNSE